MALFAVKCKVVLFFFNHANFYGALWILFGPVINCCLIFVNSDHFSITALFFYVGTGLLHVCDVRCRVETLFCDLLFLVQEQFVLLDPPNIKLCCILSKGTRKTPLFSRGHYHSYKTIPVSALQDNFCIRLMYQIAFYIAAIDATSKG